MQIITVETKMSDLHVIQTVLDFWDPYGASIFRSSKLSQIDEYDSYSFPILDLLRKNASQDDLFSFLKQTKLVKGSLSFDENEARNKFFAWAIMQIWQRHQLKESNKRILHVDSVQFPASEYRIIPRLELLQQYLQQWDPVEKSKYWLYGADTISQYDEASLLLDKSIENAHFDEICFALECACITKSDGISFGLQNHRLKGQALQESFHSHLIETSKRHKKRASLLLTIFRDPHRQIKRRIQPRKRSG